LFGKAFQEKELSIGDWKWAVYQTITRLTFHQGNKHTYAYKWSSLLEPIVCPWMKVFLILILGKVMCNICDDDMIEDMHHFLFECKTYDVSDKNCSRKLKH
jgi:hypothetical protein